MSPIAFLRLSAIAGIYRIAGRNAFILSLIFRRKDFPGSQRELFYSSSPVSR